MSLQNLVGLSLEVIAPSRETVLRLLAGAERLLKDAQAAGISAETRFGSAYTAIRMLADAGLNAHGYRVLTSKPGHHQTAIQSLPLTYGIASDVVRTIDVLRRQRNATEYSGETVSDAAVGECVVQAMALLAAAKAWLQTNKPQLL
jgi:hypothetical protein